MNPLTLAIQVSDRPHYLARTLGSLYLCDGIADCTVVAACEPMGDPAAECMGMLLQAAKDVGFELEVNRNRTVKGCNVNTRDNLARAFTLDAELGRDGYVVGIEDDTPLAPDALRWFDWIRQFGSDESVYAACALRAVNDSEDLSLTTRIDAWSPWGWSTWRDRFDEMYPRWQTDEGPFVESWDIIVGRDVRAGRDVLFPHVSRSANVGEHGVHEYPEHWREAFGELRMAGPYDGPYLLDNRSRTPLRYPAELP